MADAVERARATQVASIEALTGMPLAALLDTVAGWGPGKHGEHLKRVKETFGLTHGHANYLVHLARERAAASEGSTVAGVPIDPLDAIYAGSKAPLRALHEALLERFGALGPFDVAPKKAYVSLRRSKQFAMVGPGSRGRLEVGVNHRTAGASARFEALGPGAMCSHRAYLTAVEEIDDELLAFVGEAYAAAG